ncbi:uncharacterized protein [Nicotiana tomentosiformis]|uniref:uncharacterized protein n=1 Tax=Nicotiana tomentosiformis TaxID=4098 RepID=UPI00388C7E83
MKEQVHSKKNKGSTKAMVAAWGESSDEESDDENGDEQALMAIGESDGESHEEQSKCFYELKSENLKLKLGTSKKTVDCTQLTLEENVGKLNDELYMKDEQVQVKGSSQIWYMDSGCLKHMIGSKDQFLSLEDLKRGNVSFGNGKKGEIIVVCKVGKDDSHSTENVYLIDGLNDPLLWRKRLGHASLSQLNKLVSNDFVIGLPNIKFKEDKVCEACARGEAESIHVVFDETNILSERPEHDDEAIGLVSNLNETTAQTKAALEEGTCDGTGISRGNQLVVKPYKYQTSHLIENIITDPTSGIKTRSSLKNLCPFDAFLSLIEPKNVAEALQDANWQKYVKELLKRFKMEDSKEIDTLIATATKLDIDEPGSFVDQKLYRGMIGSLLYLTASRPDIVFSVVIVILWDMLMLTMQVFLWIERAPQQNSVALSTAEDEYVAATSCCAQLLCIKQ